ncbi:hypothetical protein ERUR111494_08235 [Erysipelothrix urinaevulpis]|uniref:hypothetical protein n=1 Tax=Erysipelothrix urinaevulpis TaxID=2683717 RepID=UPI0013580701|nr:hypothetical protein [Erysipelothrix urinaevulpis]
MVTLMTIPQTKTVLNLWKEDLKKQINDEELFKSYSEDLGSVIGHANVYIIEDGGTITDYAIIVEGYYLAALNYASNESAKILLDYVKTKYDEIQIDVLKENEKNQVLLDNQFTFIEETTNEVLGIQENAYEFLKI